MTAIPAVSDFAPNSETTPTPNPIVPRATAEMIVRQRNKALELYEVSHAAMTAAAEAFAKANEAMRSINSRETRYTYHLHSDKAKFMHVDDVQNRDDFMTVARRIVDTEAWSHIIEITDLERLMDKEAKEKLYQQLITDPPEMTLDNIFATLDQFATDAGTIFRRGIANAFSKLDRRFKSHDGFKIGSRIILDRMFDENGWWNYHRDMESTLMDVERTFVVLDGKSNPTNYGGIVGILRNTKRHGRQQMEVENEYFLVRTFFNGNCHLWFKRKDLVEKVNKLLAEYYGEVIPDGMTPEDDGGLFTQKTTPAKFYGFYPTPDDPAETIIKRVALLQSADKPPLTILEPSAGTGNLARRCFSKPIVPDGDYEWQIDQAREHNAKHRFDNQVDCIEIQPHLVEALRKEGIYRRVYNADFLTLKPETTGLYDRVVMNPPFDRERDIDHVIHALDFLKPDGQLVAIMSAGTEFRETRKSIAFRALMKKMNANFYELPARSFSSVGTNVNTIYVTVWKDGRRHYRY